MSSTTTAGGATLLSGAGGATRISAKKRSKLKRSPAVRSSPLTQTARLAGRNAQHITALTKRLRSVEKNTVSWRQYQFEDNGVIRSSEQVIAGTPYHYKRVMLPSQYTPVFQAEGIASGDEPRKFHYKKISIRWLLQPELSTYTAVNAQVFIVSLKQNSAQQFIHDTTDGQHLTLNEHYVHAPLDSAEGLTEGFGMYFINPAYFKVHYHKQVRFGGKVTGGTDVTNIEDYTKLGFHTMKWDRMIKSVKPVPFTQIDAEEIPDKARLYVYVFTNAGTDAAFWSMNCMIEGQCVAGT